MGCPDGFLSGTCFLFLFETTFQVETAGTRARPARPSSLPVKPTGCNQTRLAPETIMTTRKDNVVVQKAIAVFKRGELSLEWECPFCGDRNEWSYSNVPPFVVFLPRSCLLVTAAGRDTLSKFVKS